MKIRTFLMTVTGALVFVAAPVFPHEVQNMSHSHAFQQTGYGKYRQGHYVNGAQGSIIIWSPRTYSGYRPGPAVKFARPSPIVKAPQSPVTKTRSQNRSSIEYGKQ